MKISNNPYAYSTPSIFAISSPLQVLCAMAAIKQLKIEDYRVAICYDETDPRNQQLWAVLDYFKMFDRIMMPVSSRNINYYRLRSFLHHKNKYKRLFIGDYRGYYDFILGSSYVSDGSDVVYLDDGTATLSLLNDVITEPMRRSRKLFLEVVARKRHFVLNKNLLTIYCGLSNPRFNIENLSLENVKKTLDYKKEECRGVYIVGTNIDRYCLPLGISVDAYVRKLEELIKSVKSEYLDEPIIFVPHGRDFSEYAKIICERNGCDFRRPEMMVEMELLKSRFTPRAIYGFTSSALYNLKKMYPQTRVVNVLFNCSEDNINFKEYCVLSEYYQKNDIELMLEQL